MSLSQKHSGLILAPWFNTYEWQHVYLYVYSNDKEKQLKSLELLKIWKMRTPILPTGVEGTLIVLGALLMDTGHFIDDQVTNLYAVALMRFLNLSAANSEKQGFFNKTSIKNELPKWLIHLRHDVAHGLQLPSKSNLKMGLQYGLNWLKDKYWEPQSKIINDYYINDEISSNNSLVNTLKTYVCLNNSIFETVDLNDASIKEIKHMIYKKYRIKITDPKFMLDILEEMIRQSLVKDASGNIEKCVTVLVSKSAMLKLNFEVVSEDEGNEQIDKGFRNIWKNLINLLHNEKLLFRLINKLFETVGDISYSENTKKMASMWIKEILLSLQKLKETSKENYPDSIDLDSNKTFYNKEALEFEKKVLYSANKYCLYFTDALLKYNEKSENFLKDALNLLKCENDIKATYQMENQIFTLEDLKVENLTIDDIEFTDLSQNLLNVLNDSNDIPTQIIGGSKWKKIDDTSIFKDCPLGVLPHQINNKHPFFLF